MSGSAGVPGMAANAVKVVATDLAFAAANGASQLFGGESYRTDTYVGRAAADLRPFRIFEGSNDVLCDAIAQAAEKEAKGGGETFEEAVRGACALADRPPPPLDAFAERGAGGGLPQGLRCLGGRMLANAYALRECARRGLAGRSVQPLLARIERDAHAAATWRDGAGLAEY